MEVIEKLNISYTNSDNDDQKLDLFYKGGGGNDNERPLVIYIHGGFWVARDKKEYTILGQYLSNEYNVATAIINYRKTPTVVYPEHNNDLVRSIIWLVENSNGKYSTDKIILIGHSCGCHMQTTIALEWDKYIDALGYNESYKSIKNSFISLIGIQGIFNLVGLHIDFPSYLSDIELVFGKNWYDITSIDQTNLNKETTNWLFIHSPQDTWVNERQSTDAMVHLKDVLKFKNIFLENQLEGAHFQVVEQLGNKFDKSSENTRLILKKFFLNLNIK